MSTQADTATAVATYQLLPLVEIHESRTNPRQHFDDALLAELTESVRQSGVLQPILVRPRVKGGGYEIVAGARRVRAARAAQLAEVPAMVGALTDDQVLEVQVIENLQRADLHPLEEARGYDHLIRRAHYDVARIAERVGRSASYVYDRVKLLALTPDAQALFLEGRIQAGHAVILARLAPPQQARAIGTAKAPGPLFTHERLLWDPDEIEAAQRGGRLPPPRVKAVTARELQAWVDEHVRFDVAGADVPLVPSLPADVEALLAEAIHPMIVLDRGPAAKIVGRLASALRALHADRARVGEAIEHALNELGVPQPGYPQPVANAVDILRAALAARATEGGSDGR